MKKTPFFALFICLLLTSCATYRQAGEGGCYFKQVKQRIPKNVIRM
jgi:hypothetical protein